MVRTPTAEDLALVPTCGEIEFTIPRVTWPDGSPFTIQLRALDARQSADVDRKATKAGAQHGTSYDDYTALVWTVFYAISKPRLTENQMGVLWDMNASILAEIADYLATLAILPARELQAHLERLAGVAVPEKKSRKRGSARPIPPSGHGDTPRNQAGDAAKPG